MLELVAAKKAGDGAAPLVSVKKGGRTRGGNRRKPPRHGEIAIVTRSLEVEAYLARYRAASARAIDRCLADPFLLARDVLPFGLWLQTSRCGIPDPKDEADLYPMLYTERHEVIPKLVEQLRFDAVSAVAQWRTCVLVLLLRRLGAAEATDALLRLMRVPWGRYVVLGALGRETTVRVWPSRPTEADRIFVATSEVRAFISESLLDPTLLGYALEVAQLHGIEEVDGASVLPLIDTAPVPAAVALFPWLARIWPDARLLARACEALVEPRFARNRSAVLSALGELAAKGEPSVVAEAVDALTDFLNQHSRPGRTDLFSDNERDAALKAIARAAAAEADQALLAVVNDPRESPWIRRRAGSNWLERQSVISFAPILSSTLGPQDIADIIKDIPSSFRWYRRDSPPAHSLEAMLQALADLATRSPMVGESVTTAIEALKVLEGPKASRLDQRAARPPHPADLPAITARLVQLGVLTQSEADAASAGARDLVPHPVIADSPCLRILMAAGRLLRLEPNPHSQLPNYVQLFERLRSIGQFAFDPAAVTQEMTGTRGAQDGAPFVIRFVSRGRLIEYRVPGRRDSLDLLTTVNVVNHALAADEQPVRLFRFSAGMDEALFAFLEPGVAEAVVRLAGRKLVRERRQTVNRL
jgi:hypothetical protein